MAFQPSRITYPQYEKLFTLSGVRPLAKSTVLNHLKNVVSLILHTLAQQSFVEERKQPSQVFEEQV
jgi:hypothetical protein